MLPTDSGQSAVQPQLVNRLIQFHLYKTQYDLALARQSGNLTLTQSLLLTLARTYRDYHLLPQAITTLEQAIGIAHLNADRHEEGGLLYVLAEVCQANGEADTALTHFRRALSIAEEVNDPYLKAASLDALRRTKTAIMVEAMRHPSSDLLPPVAASPVVPDHLWHSLVLALTLFTVGFVLVPILLSRAGISDGIIALNVIAASVIGLVMVWRRR